MFSTLFYLRDIRRRWLRANFTEIAKHKTIYLFANKWLIVNRIINVCNTRNHFTMFKQISSSLFKNNGKYKLFAYKSCKHTHAHIYIYMCVCVCTVGKMSILSPAEFLNLPPHQNRNIYYFQGRSILKVMNRILGLVWFLCLMAYQPSLVI